MLAAHSADNIGSRRYKEFCVSGLSFIPGARQKRREQILQTLEDLLSANRRTDETEKHPASRDRLFGNPNKKAKLTAHSMAGDADTKQALERIAQLERPRVRRSESIINSQTLCSGEVLKRMQK